MPTEPVATRLPQDVAQHVEPVAESPATPHESKSEVVRELVVERFEDT
jgi:hypothetical protein